MVDIIHDFATYYKGIKFNKSLISRASLDGVIKLPFTNEHIDPLTYETDLLPLSLKILSSYKGNLKLIVDDRMEFCRNFVKTFKDYDKTVLSKNPSKIELLVNAAH